MGSRSTSGRPWMPERGRNSRSTHHNTSLPYHQSIPGSTLANSSGPATWISSEAEGLQPEQPGCLDYLNFFDLRSVTPTSSSLLHAAQRDGGQLETTGPSSPLHVDSAFSVSPALPQFSNTNNVDLLQTSFPSPGSPTWQPWGNSTGSGSIFNAQSVDTPMSDSQSGTYGSLDTFGVPTPDTYPSDCSGNLDFSPQWGSPTSSSALLPDQKLPVDYFGYPLSNTDHSSIPRHDSQSSIEQQYGISQVPDLLHWSATGFRTTSDDRELLEKTVFQQPPSLHQQTESLIQQTSWTTLDGQFRKNVNSDVMTFESPPGYPHDVYIEREKLLLQQLPERQVPSPTSTMFIDDSEHDSWGQPTPRQLSPNRIDRDTPPQEKNEHIHVFSMITGVEIPRSVPGHTRKLTPEKKRRTLAVRKNKACWACHLSKTQCSPCSSGSPCEKCADLLGRRRFCRLPCFNNTIESLHPFLVPDMLVGHFTEENVKSFVREHAASWGTRSLHVRMSWGSRIHLTANVVQLFTHKESSELGLQHQIVPNAGGRPTLVRTKSPPLGIPLASMTDLQEEYLEHIQGVIRDDLAHYVSIAYDSQGSNLPGSLLRALCVWYQMGVKAGDRCALLEETIEIHVIGTILERSLILDEASINDVQAHLRQEFPRRSAPRCAQRQIKLAFYMLQRPRIVNVLGQWGKLMRNTADSNNKWATTLCTFLLLTLLMDKTITAAYYLYKDRIYDKKDERTEREEFQRLVRLMETELFERCKEIFHTRYKTRKGANERFNPIRDGIHAWRKELPDEKTICFVNEMQRIVRDFDHEVLRPSFRVDEPPSIAYTNLGRLASIFLGDLIASS